MTESNQLVNAQKVISIVVAGLSIIPATFLLIKVNKRIPVSFLLTILLHVAVIILRAFNDQLNFDSLPQIIITVICYTLIDFIFASFVFQLQSFRTHLTAETPKELKRAIKILRITKLIVNSVNLISTFPKLYTELQFIKDDGQSDPL